MKSYKLLFAILLLSYCCNAQMYLDTPSVVQPVQQAKIMPWYHYHILNNKLVFTASKRDGSTGTEWWQYDGTNVSLSPETNPGSGRGVVMWDAAVYYKRIAAVINGNLYYSGYNTTYGEELFKWDGTSNSPAIVKDFVTGIAVSTPREFTVINNKLYFMADSSQPMTNVYEYDPVTNKTATIRININRYGTLASHDDKLIIMTKNSNNVEFNTVTRQFKNFQGGTLDNFTSYGSKLYFTSTGAQSYLLAYDNNNSNAIASATGLQAVINTMLPSHEPKKSILAAHGRVYFWLNDRLSYYDTMNGQVASIPGMKTFSGGARFFHIEHQNKIYFNDEKMLIRYDGTKADTILPFDFNAYGMMAFNNDVYVAAVGYGVDTYMLYKLNDTLVPGTPPGVSIQSINFKGDILLYPNPTRGNTHLKIKLDNATSLTAMVNDITGKTVYKTTPALYSSGQSEIELPVKDLPAGTYVVSLVNSYGTILWSGKLLRQ